MGLDLSYRKKLEDMIRRFREAKVIPVIAMEDAGASERLADALCEGGLPAAEVTFRTEAAAEIIDRMRRRHPEMLVGAGTVLTSWDADAAAEAGAEFIVSPGLNPEIVEYSIGLGIPVCPGVATASEIERAMSFGLNAVKFFPAEMLGGLRTIRALSAPYKDMQFMPTGGVTPEGAAEYLKYDRIFAVGGSWIVKQDTVLRGDFETIRRLARMAQNLSREES